MIDTLFANWRQFASDNPDIHDAINEGYAVAAYDEETGFIIVMEKDETDNKTIQVKVVMDAYYIPKLKDGVES